VAGEGGLYRNRLVYLTWDSYLYNFPVDGGMFSAVASSRSYLDIISVITVGNQDLMERAARLLGSELLTRKRKRRRFHACGNCPTAQSVAHDPVGHTPTVNYTMHSIWCMPRVPRTCSILFWGKAWGHDVRVGDQPGTCGFSYPPTTTPITSFGFSGLKH
jgi:hypothetical protein